MGLILSLRRHFNSRKGQKHLVSDFALELSHSEMSPTLETLHFFYHYMPEKETLMFSLFHNQLKLLTGALTLRRNPTDLSISW